MHYRILLICSLMIISSLLQAQQSCHDQISYSTPRERFKVPSFDVSSVDDAQTGLTWQRCPVGFTINDNGTPRFYEDDTCEETSAKFLDWQNALVTAESVNSSGGIGGFTDWRLPNIKELSSIVERKCVYPAMNTRIFPPISEVEEDEYWSTTTYDTINEAATINFRFGDTDKAIKTNTDIYTRLVRKN